MAAAGSDVAGGSLLDSLRAMTTVVADTGEIERIKEFKPQDATTNPSLLNSAARLPEYAALVDEAVAYAKAHVGEGASERTLLDLLIDRLSVNFGLEILKHVPGYVSTEVDARLSFDAAANVERARRIIAMYEAAGVSRDRVLIKLATTWEGLRAAEVLEREGIHCNMTLLFAFCQAVEAANAGATLISPFVGRILDWHKAKAGRDFAPSEDPGVHSVRRIFNYYKATGAATIVMGASFRNVGEVLELAGCDRLTISPALLNDLRKTAGAVERKLSAEGAAEAAAASGVPTSRIAYTEAEFRWQLNEDPMATEKLAEGIRKFGEDIDKLETFLKTKL